MMAFIFAVTKCANEIEKNRNELKKMISGVELALS
jgi:chloramphenicol O-acetyltransferase